MQKSYRVHPLTYSDPLETKGRFCRPNYCEMCHKKAETVCVLVVALSAELEQVLNNICEMN